MNKQMTNALSSCDNTPVVLIGSDGQVEITSVELTHIINNFRLEEGNTINKEHNDMMKSIRKEIETLEAVGISQGNFSLTSYNDSQNKERPCYKMNKAGALQILNKESAVVRYKTVQYIEKLEKQVKHKPLTPQEELRLHYQVIEQQSQEIQEVKAEVNDLKDNMPLFNVECKELQSLVKKKGIDVLGGYKTNAYNDKSLRTRVYSDIQMQLRREFGVSRYEAIKRSQLEIARNIIDQYKAPTVLIQEINTLNSQMSFIN